MAAGEGADPGSLPWLRAPVPSPFRLRTPEYDSKTGGIIPNFMLHTSR
jgi:hypothetical protein